MKKQLNKNKNNKINTKLSLVIYAFVSEILFFTAVCILALVLDIKDGSYYIFSLAAVSAGSAASGFITARIIKHKGMLNGIIYALPSNIIFTLISAASNSFRVDYNILISFALLVICSAAGGVASVNIRSRKVIIPKHVKR